MRSGKKGRRNQNQTAVDEASSSSSRPHAADDNHYEDEEFDEEEAMKHMTKKDLAKAMKKRQKAEAREARAAALAARKEKEAEEEEARLEAEEERAEKEARRAEERRKKKEAKEKADKKEYDKWKTMFEVEEEGDNTGGGDAVPFGALSDFESFVRTRKVVMLQDLATEFALDTVEAASRLAALEQMGRITGVFDDRGKFVYITLDEMEKVAKFIERRGRVSIAALSVESNRLIDLESAATPAVAEGKEEENIIL